MIKALVSLLVLSLISTSHSQEPKESKGPQLESNLLKKHKHAFEALPKQQRIEYLKIKKQAAEDLAKAKYFSCLLKTIEAEKVFGQDYEIFFWRGICYSRWNDHEEAIKLYQRVLKVHGDNVSVAMSLYEAFFITNQYEKCVFVGDKLRLLYNSDKFPYNQIPLLEFKRLLSLKKLNTLNPNPSLEKEITAVSKFFTSNHDTPFAYYSLALENYEKKQYSLGDLNIRSAIYVFERKGLKLWDKALYDAGYIGEFRSSRIFSYLFISEAKEVIKKK